jgi:prevent-host-death family protein
MNQAFTACHAGIDPASMQNKHWLSGICKMTPMRTVGVFEAKNRFPELLNAVEHGEEITITRHGNPAARIVSVSTGSQGDSTQRARVTDAMLRLRSLRQGAELGTTLAQAINGGRD